jgi:photosystem II stability/assembly factor-like uncharacterized protein
MRRLAVVAALWASALTPRLALGNGRPPATNGVQFSRADPRSIYVASTFGLLVSKDAGCSFHWVCEDNVRYRGMFDPIWRVTPDAIFATTVEGLRISHDGGCSFTTATEALPAGAPGRIADKWIAGLDISPTGDVWVATADSGKPNDVYRSIDGGATFAPSGLASPTIWWRSLLVAPGRAARVYVTGYEVAGTAPDGGTRPPATHVRITDDLGARWTESPLAGVMFAPVPLVLVVGVDRDNPDIVLLRSAGANPPQGDRLYRSTDGGVTWAEVLATAAPIADVAMTRAGGVLVATTGGGAFRSSDHGATFGELAGAPQLGCIGEAADGTLYGCGANWEPDFKAVARSSDGAAWSKVFRFVELAGPLDCPAGTAEHDVCGAQWPAVKEQFGATGASSCEPVLNDDVAAPAKKPGAGCCDAGRTDGFGALALVAALTGFGVLRRRR